jgi:glycosyltransferase involved in cell wall biosynthesis
MMHILPASIRNSKFLNKIFGRILLFPNINDILKANNINEVDLLWLHGNGDLFLSHIVPHKTLVIRMVDNYNGFRLKQKTYNNISKAIFQKADLIICCSHYVKELNSYIGREIKVVPNGVDYEYFSNPSGQAIPQSINNIQGSKIVYVGSVSSWFDWNLVIFLAQNRPNLNFIIIGPSNGFIDPKVAVLENIYCLGSIRYDLLPMILKYCDIGIVPFKLNKLTKGVSPIKIYEYLASGLPVISTRWKELEIQKMPIMLPSNKNEFLDAIDLTLSGGNISSIIRKDFSKNSSWEKRLQQIMNELQTPL